AFPAAINDPKDEKSVMATLDAMAQATIKKDVATLDKIYHPDLTYSHSSAMNQTKAEVLKAVAGPGVTESMTFHETSVRIYGNVAKEATNLKLSSAFLLAALISGSIRAESTPVNALLVLSKGDTTLAIVDPSTLKVVARIPSGPAPHEVIASTDGKTAYISNY